MDQQIVNWIIAGFGTLIGFLLHAIWDAVKDLQKADAAINAKVGSIEVLVAGNYITRDEFKREVNALFMKLDKIYDKLDAKQDKDTQ